MKAGTPYEQETNGVVVRAAPAYLAQESKPDAQRYVWSYTIEIENRTDDTVQLLSRHWRITDAHGITHDVQGAGVVGEQPVLHPGDTFRYTSACPLSAPSGLMVGEYQMVRSETGERFDVAVPTFALDSPHAARLAN